MDTSVDVHDEYKPSAASARLARRFQINVRVLIALVACCGMVLWAARVLWHQPDPVIAETRAQEQRAIRALQSRDVSERLSAIRELAGIPYGESAVVMPPLIERLDDADADVRVLAASTLGVFGNKALQIGEGGQAVSAAMTALVKSLKDGQPRVRMSAASALVTMISNTSPTSVAYAPSVCAALGAALDDRDEDVREAVLKAISLVANRTSVSPPPGFIAALEDESAKNRLAAAEAVSCFDRGLDPLMAPLFRGLETARPPFKSAYEQAMKHIVARSALRQSRPSYTVASLPVLLAALGRRDREVRSSAAYLLGRLGPDAEGTVPALIAILNEDDHGSETPNDLTVKVVEALGRIAAGTDSAGEAVAALAGVVRSDDPAQRQAALDALAGLGPTSAAAIPALLDALQKDAAGGATFRMSANSSSWLLARLAAGTTSADTVIAALTGVVRSGTAMTRREAAEGLAVFGKQAATAVPVVIKALNESTTAYRDNDRLELIKTLGAIAPGTAAETQAITVLVDLSQSKSRDVRQWAIRTLSQFGPQASSAIAGLRALLKHPDGETRKDAAAALEQLNFSR
jgi:HEAT repeat protein